MSRRAFRKIHRIAVAFGGLLCSSTSQAADLLILPGSGGEFVRECANKDVVISGSKSKFVLTGGCQSLSVPGDGNQILVDMAPGSEIYLRGNENDIAWTKEHDSPSPTIVADGQANSIVQLGGEVTKAEVVPATTAPAPIAPAAATTSAPTTTTSAVPPAAIVREPIASAVTPPITNGKEQEKAAPATSPEEQKDKIAKIEPAPEPLDDVKTGVLLDLHSAVSRTLRQCARGQRGDESLCRYLISGPK
jgi:Protein of unknown function (DUF3060)